MKCKFHFLIGLILVFFNHFSVYAIDKLKYDQLNAELFKDFVNLIDSNIALFSLLASVGGVIIAPGDLRTRATGAGLGIVTALMFWAISKKLVGI